MLIDMRVDFRTTVVEWKSRGIYLIALDLMPETFRYVELVADADEDAKFDYTLASSSTSDYFAALESEDLHPIGYMDAMLLEISKCKLHFSVVWNRYDQATHQLPSCLDECFSLTATECLQRAREKPWVAPDASPIKLGANPSSWCHFFGWRNVHKYVGNAETPRVHLFGCPFRSVTSGQNASSDQPPPTLPDDNYDDGPSANLRSYCGAGSGGDLTSEETTPQDGRYILRVRRQKAALASGEALAKRELEAQAAAAQAASRPLREEEASKEGLSDYERERFANIERNQKVLEELGLI